MEQVHHEAVWLNIHASKDDTYIQDNTRNKAKYKFHVERESLHEDIRERYGNISIQSKL